MSICTVPLLGFLLFHSDLANLCVRVPFFSGAHLVSETGLVLQGFSLVPQFFFSCSPSHLGLAIRGGLVGSSPQAHPCFRGLVVLEVFLLPPLLSPSLTSLFLFFHMIPHQGFHLSVCPLFFLLPPISPLLYTYTYGSFIFQVFVFLHTPVHSVGSCFFWVSVIVYSSSFLFPIAGPLAACSWSPGLGFGFRPWLGLTLFSLFCTPRGWLCDFNIRFKMIFTLV